MLHKLLQKSYLSQRNLRHKQAHHINSRYIRCTNRRPNHINSRYIRIRLC